MLDLVSQANWQFGELLGLPTVDVADLRTGAFTPKPKNWDGKDLLTGLRKISFNVQNLLHRSGGAGKTKGHWVVQRYPKSIQGLFDIPQPNSLSRPRKLHMVSET